MVEEATPQSGSEDAKFSLGQVGEWIRFLREELVRVAVFGEFSTGKSTLLNALMGEDILSAVTEPTTAVPTVISWAKAFNIHAVGVDGTRTSLFESAPPFWARFVGNKKITAVLEHESKLLQGFVGQYSREGSDAIERVDRLEITIALGLLAGQLSLIDTPGTNASVERHRHFTEQVANSSDVALILLSPKQLGKATEVQFAISIAARVPECVLVLNKCDELSVDERSEVLEEVLQELLPRHWPGSAPPVYMVSAREALLGEGDEDLLAQFSSLQERVVELATQERGRLLLDRLGNPERWAFAQGRELEQAGKYSEALEYFEACESLLRVALLDGSAVDSAIQRVVSRLEETLGRLENYSVRFKQIEESANEDPFSAAHDLKNLICEMRGLRLDVSAIESFLHEVEGVVGCIEEAREMSRRSMDALLASQKRNRWEDVQAHINDVEVYDRQARELPSQTSRKLTGVRAWLSDATMRARSEESELLQFGGHARMTLNAVVAAEKINDLLEHSAFLLNEPRQLEELAGRLRSDWALLEKMRHSRQTLQRLVLSAPAQADQEAVAEQLELELTALSNFMGEWGGARESDGEHDDQIECLLALSAPLAVECDHAPELLEQAIVLSVRTRPQFLRRFIDILSRQCASDLYGDGGAERRSCHAALRPAPSGLRYRRRRSRLPPPAPVTGSLASDLEALTGALDRAEALLVSHVELLKIWQGKIKSRKHLVLQLTQLKGHVDKIGNGGAQDILDVLLRFTRAAVRYRSKPAIALIQSINTMLVHPTESGAILAARQELADTKFIRLRLLMRLSYRVHSTGSPDVHAQWVSEQDRVCRVLSKLSYDTRPSQREVCDVITAELDEIESRCPTLAEWNRWVLDQLRSRLATSNSANPSEPVVKRGGPRCPVCDEILSAGVTRCWSCYTSGSAPSGPAPSDHSLAGFGCLVLLIILVIAIQKLFR